MYIIILFRTCTKWKNCCAIIWGDHSQSFRKQTTQKARVNDDHDVATVCDSCGKISAKARRLVGRFDDRARFAGRMLVQTVHRGCRFRRSADHSRRASCGTAKMANGSATPHSYARCSSALVRRSVRG